MKFDIETKESRLGYRKPKTSWVTLTLLVPTLLACGVILGDYVAVEAYVKHVSYEPVPEVVTAEISAYTSRVEETDSTPCISASGMNICETDKNVIACPRHMKLGTIVEIDGIRYSCEDRMNIRYKDRFDLYFGHNLKAALNWGVQTKEVKIYGHKNM